MLASLLLALCACAGAQTYTLDPSTGALRARLYRDGPLAAFGHDHVIAAPSFEGAVELSSATATLRLSVDARALKIDEDAVREALDLRTISAADRVEIDKTMRGAKGLDVESFPTMRLVSQSIEPVPDEKDLWHVIGAFTLHGSTQTIEAPVAVRDGPGGGRWFSGYVRLRQTDFGIKPYSAFGGAVKVRDDFVVSFDLLGRPERR